MDRSFQRDNDEARERLATLVATLTPTQLSIDLGEGWTVASAIGHIGFWDRWQGDRWEDMLAGRWTADSESVLAAEHLANDALHPYWAGVNAADLPHLALEAATRLDALIASAPDDVVASLEGTPIAFLLHRHGHRGEHLDHIERKIAEANASATAADFAERNAQSRRHLAALLERLRDVDMALPTEPTDEGSWTIAQVLGHMAFWDRSLQARWEMARDAAAAQAGPLEPTYLPAGITEAVNRPLADLIAAWTERLGPAVGAEALAAAESLDALIEELAPRLPDGVLSVLPRVVNRWIHREAHIEQIERGLAAGRPGAAAPTTAAATASADTSYLARNDAAHARLVAFVDRLELADLARPVGDGTWTAGILLGHMAFWDRFLAARWQAALAAGATQPMSVGHELADLLNAALAPSWAALAAAGVEALRAEVVAAAGEVDGIIRSLPGSVPTASIVGERPALLDRSLHRAEHLADLEAALAR